MAPELLNGSSNKVSEKITCSTLSQLLDSVLEQEGFQIGSVCGKKKRKAIKLHKSDLHNDVIRKDENALSFLSSILDILLLKKDRENNSSHDHAKQLIASTASSAPRRPYFTTTITPTNYDRGYPYLVSFCLNRWWPVKLKITKRGHRLSWGCGWHEYYESNKLKVGDLYILELNPTSPETPNPVLDV